MKTLYNDQSPARRAFWAVFVYLMVGVAWILFSDRVAEAWFPDPQTLSMVQTWKGFLFVLITGAVLFMVLWRQLAKDRVLLRLQAGQRRALIRRERQMTVLMDNLPGMAYRCRFDQHWTMLFVSQGCTQLTGYEPDELTHNRVTSYASLIGDADNERLICEVEEALEQGQPFALEYALTRKDGRTLWVWERGRGVEDDNGALALEGIILDISGRKALENELEKLATQDPLTGLCNRRELSRILDEELARATRYQRSLAVLWIDVDHFKDINDTHGHAAGDSVLRSVSQLLAGSIRTVDAIGRFGGEEFVIVLPEMDAESAQDTADRLRRRIADTPQPLGDGQTVTLTVSVGISAYPEHGQTADQLCAAADKAMYLAKERGRNCVVMAHLHERLHHGSWRSGEL
ncbi:MAG TPA: sensor domain-containing diguanylate cyclase [Marinobacter sp.]|uniref:sensor domain-containing diguanylate cyclase n=1 Tax=Marinobacter sp. TaxID=50741 RepID=UPI002D7F1D08|nr:sensor domain-containing diguanylate cyclase [Marinobacter sp.]HET8799822.1 sensor domain-containing diguanylate cyclase [Marinobacter sp.]